MKNFLRFCRTTVSVAKQPSPDITQFFTGHCAMPGANIQASKITQFLEVALFWLNIENYFKKTPGTAIKVFPISILDLKQTGNIVPKKICSI